MHNENEDENEKYITQIRHRQTINRPRSKHGRKYSKDKMCPSMMMLICINEHLSNI